MLFTFILNKCSLVSSAEFLKEGLQTLTRETLTRDPDPYVI